MLLSRKYIRQSFMRYNIQINEEALNILCNTLKSDIEKYSLNAKDLGIKRLTKEKVPIIIVDFDVEWYW